MKRFPQFRTVLFCRALTLFSTATVFTGLLPAQAPVPANGTYDFYGDATYDGTAGSIAPVPPFAAPTVWQVADDATVTVQNNIGTANGGVFGGGLTTSLTIVPMGSSGRVVFKNNTTTGEGAIFTLGNNANADVNITGADFIGNHANLTGTGNSGAGIFRSPSNAGILIEITDSLFQKNSARYAGVAFSAANINVNNSTFIGNAAHRKNNTGAGDGTIENNSFAGRGGVFYLRHNQARLTLVRESEFSGNWAARSGGVFSTGQSYSVELWDTKNFTNNFAGFGGAISDNTNLRDPGDGFLLKYTGTTGITDFVYSGNRAKGEELLAAEIDAARNNGEVPFANAAAKGGGFYYSGNLNDGPTTATQLRFEIASDVTVQIGQAGNPSSWDSIATSDATGVDSKLRLIDLNPNDDVVPAGKLILHADNSYFQGSVDVEVGSLILGNQNASLGGVINVASGATFGGAGTLVTHKQDDSVFAGRTSLTLANGAILAVGTDTASTGESLSVAGNVSIGSGVVFNHDLFSDGFASKLVADNLSLSGPATVNLGLLASGTFTLMEWRAGGINPAGLSNLSLTIDGVQGSSRATAALSLAGNSLVATATVNNLVMNWTGADGAIWTRRTSGAQRNWTDAGGSGETKYYNGDSVAFNGQADAANPGNRIITIANGGVTASGMAVSGAERYEFRGNGGIEIDATAVGSAAFTPTGKLIKSGVGELVFANTAANTFERGIDIAGGTITFDRGAQLGAGAAGIVFSDSATLRATSTVSGTLAGSITVAAGKTAELKVDQGGALAYAGTLAAGGAGAMLRKTGAGTMLLSGDNSVNTVAVAVDAGSIKLAQPTAVLGGNITVNAGATLAGVGTAGSGGSVKVSSGGILAAGIDGTQPATLTVHNLQMTGGAVLKLDLFKDADSDGYQKSDRVLEAGTSAISGVNVIAFDSFVAGTFNLGNPTGLAADGVVMLSGMTLSDTGRLSAQLSGNGGVLELVMASDQSRIMTWTGSGASSWNLANGNWTDNGAVNHYSYGDRVLFDGTSGADRRSILIDAEEVRIADMTVSGNTDHTFSGGGIHASVDNVQDDGAGNVLISDATGKLTKTGNGVLTFANDKNTFLGGIELGGGVLVVGRGDQLVTSDSTGIAFTGDATVRASADLSLDDDVTIATGKTAAVDSAGHAVTLKGTLTGDAGTTFGKDGAGTVVLETGLADFAGTLAVRGGTLRMGAENQLTNGNQAGIVVNAGATLDLAGHNQSLANLSGPGEVALGDAELTYAVESGEETFAGRFTGSGTVIKDGDGKWILSGSSTNTGGFLLRVGGLGVASNAALGAGALRVNAPSGRVSLEADGLNIANNIAVSDTLTVASNGHDAELSGNISGNTVVLGGTGTLTLSGFNSYASLQVNTPLVVARRAESIAGTVNISDGSTLEFRGADSGLVAATLTGDRVLFTNSTLALNGQNDLKNLVIGGGSQITASSTGALGGSNADITVRDGGGLFVSSQGTLGHNVTVDGGTLVFGSSTYGSDYKLSSLALSGGLNFVNGGEIRLGGRLSTGVYTAVVADGGIANLPEYDSAQDGVFMTVDIVGGNELRINAYDMALEPGKDIVAGIDAMGASMDAVYSHLSDQLLAPLDYVEKPVAKKGRRGARPRAAAATEAPATEKSVWFRVIGSFAEHETDKQYLGYTANTRGGVVGYDWISGKKLMVGGFAGSTSTRIKTANNATTEIDLPIVGAYGALRMGNYYVAGDIAGGLGGADTKRREELNDDLNGSYDLDSLAGSLEVGRVIPFFSAGLVRPSLGVHYTSLSFHDYAETGKGAVRLDDISTDILQAVVRLDFSKEIKLPGGMSGMVDLGIGWRRGLHEEQTEVRATMVDYPDATLQIRGDEYDSNATIARLGIRALISPATQASLSYDYNYVPFGNHRNATRRDTFIASLRHTW